MQKNLIKNYIKNMSKEDIYNYIEKNGYDATNKEVDIIYNHIKTYYNELLETPLPYIKMLKDKISNDNYYLILELIAFSNNIWKICWCSIKTEIFV